MSFFEPVLFKLPDVFDRNLSWIGGVAKIKLIRNFNMTMYTYNVVSMSHWM